MHELEGYRGKSLELLKSKGIDIGDVIEVLTEKKKLVGTLVPRYAYDDEFHIVIKLDSGYNIGIGIEKIKEIKTIKKGQVPSFKVPEAPEGKESLPKVALISTGGTIASRVDYRTGAVHPAISANELYALVPELSNFANVEPEIYMSIYSENIEPEHWRKLSLKVEEAVKAGFQGVVITHGTDTMAYTSAALSFSLRGIPIPIVLVGAQRSSDRPSSDAALNLIAAVHFAAESEFSGVYVAMHNNESDDKIAFHLGTRVRKNHTSARKAFQSIGIEPVAYWEKSKITYNFEGLPKRRKDNSFKSEPKFDENVVLLKFYPSLKESIVKYLIDSGIKALVIEGSGLGHINSKNIIHLRRYVEKGGLVFMTSQCIWGRVNLNVYETGRDLLQAGVIPLEDMLPETALVKSMWSLANSRSREETIEMMRTDVFFEMLERTIL